MEPAQSLPTFMQPSPSRRKIPPSFVADLRSPPPWTVESHAETMHSSVVSPVPSPSMPPEVYRHIRALRSCEAEDLKIGLSLARERKFDHLMALMDYQTTDVLRWHASPCLYDGPSSTDHGELPNQLQFRNPLTRPSSSLRNSNASTWSSASDARSSLVSTSTANTQYSVSLDSFPDPKNPPSIPPSRINSGSEYSIPSNAGHEVLLRDLRTSVHIPKITSPPPPPEIELPHVPSTTFFCTCCSEKYRKKEDWEVHESLHQRTAEWRCDACDKVLNSYRVFRDHHKRLHGCRSCKNHADDAMVVLKTKLTWGCGFCVKTLNDLKERNKHIAKHFSKEKKVMSDWSYSTVVKSLLQEPTVAAAWTSIINERASQAAEPTSFFWNKDESNYLVTELEYKKYDGDFQSLVLLLRKLYDLGWLKPGGMHHAHSTQNASPTKRHQALPRSSPQLHLRIPGSLVSQTQQDVIRPQQRLQNHVHTSLQSAVYSVPRPDSEVFQEQPQLVLQRLGVSVNPEPLQSTARASASDLSSEISRGYRGNTVMNYSRLRQPSDPLRKATRDAILSIQQGASRAFHSTVNPQDLHVWSTPDRPHLEPHPIQPWPADEIMSTPLTRRPDTPAVQQDADTAEPWPSSYHVNFSDLINSNCASDSGRVSPTYDSRRTSAMDLDSSGFANPSFF